MPCHYQQSPTHTPGPALISYTSHLSQPATDPWTQPRPRDSNPPRTTPTTAPGPDRYLANSPGHHQPSPPVNATSHRHLRHPQPSPPIAARHHHSHRHSWHSPAITAVTATSAPGLGYHTAHSRHISAGTTCHPRAVLRPPSRITIMHHHRPNPCTPHPAPAPPHHPTTTCLCVSSARPLHRMTYLNLAPPHAVPGSHPKPQHRNLLLVE
ncbi:hypothetical protein C0993_008754 [Termitomyces sp. T159_Od127]|nr:hypothetical protein C0993_008754 [Termitomyces sp. T159_Od127]